MIYFYLTLILLIGFNFYIINMESERPYVYASASALIMIMFYVPLKSFIIRARPKISPSAYRFFSIFMIPLFTLTIACNLNFMADSHLLKSPIFLGFVCLVLADFYNVSAKYIEGSDFFARQKDGFFFPSENSEGSIWWYFVKIGLLYAIVLLFGDKLTVIK